jgi:hypothetical protein
VGGGTSTAPTAKFTKWRNSSISPCEGGECKGGCSPATPDDPASIPHDTENRGVETGSDQELESAVQGLFPPPPQVTEPARRPKVETRVRTPLGLRRSGAISGFHMSEWPRIGPAAYTSGDAGDAVPSIAASPLKGRERFPAHGSACQRTADRECMPERPLSSTSVGSVNENCPERSVRSRTSRETRISPPRASAAIRAARTTSFP